MTGSMGGAVVVDFPCSVCGKPVGYQELYPPGVPRRPDRGPENPGRALDRHWHYISNGDRDGFGELSPAEFDRAVQHLTGADPASFVALYCHECERVYCFDHWRVEYSDEPPRSFGTCREGHGHVIDMG
jgi:hypothetical protein